MMAETKWTAKSGQSLGEKYKGDPRGCQDYAIAWATERGSLAVACDGAGSSRCSQIASKKVAEAVSAYFQSQFPDSGLSNFSLQDAIIRVLARALIDLYQQDRSKLKDYHTTVLFVYHHFASNQYYCGHVGDGMIVGVKEAGLEILSQSETGEGASNQTYFADHAAFIKHGLLRVNQGSVANYIGFMCFSDGVEDYVHLCRKVVREYYERKEKTPLQPDLLAIFNKLQEIHLDKIIKERWIDTGHADDDCCLAIIKNSAKSCRLDFRQEHDFYKQALEAQKKNLYIPPYIRFPNPVRVLPTFPRLRCRVRILHLPAPP